MNYYWNVLNNKYATFEGRASRAEYWYFVLFNIIIAIFLFFIDNAIGPISKINTGLLSLIYRLFILTPSLAVSVRRLHDIGESGWKLLLGLIPILGNIWLLILFILDGDPKTNKYGPSPKNN